MSDMETKMLLIRWMEVMNAMYRLIREVDDKASVWPNYPEPGSPLRISYDIAVLLGKGLRDD